MKSEVIYLHFLNRELYRELNLKKRELDRILKETLAVTWLTSYEPMVTSIAFVWEVYVDYPNTRAFLLELLKNDCLKLISAFFTVDEFLASNRILYRNECARYKMYFSNTPTALLSFCPDIHKSSNTTVTLENTLTGWAETGSSALFKTEEDEKLILAKGKEIKTALHYREDRAITISLFDNLQSNVYYKKQLARNLSLIHINDYMQAINGDIVTGILCLNFYDRLAVDYPFRDFILNKKIISICDQRAMEYTNFCRLIQCKDDQLKSFFASTLRDIVKCLYKIYAKTEVNPYNIRYTILNRLTEAQGCLSVVNDKEQISWALLTYRIQQLDEYFKKNDMRYRVIRTEKDMIKIMLLCTATDAETDAIINKAEELGLQVVPSKYENIQVFHLGILGKLNLYLTQTEMGTERMGSARDKIRDLAKIMKPNYILSTGICYGLKPAGRKYPDGNHIGDVIVANQIQMYETQKIVEKGGQMKFIPRGDKAPVSTELLDAFHTAKHLYRNKCAEISFGLLLTGNLLVNSRTVVGKLKEIFLEPINGDMEAGGIYSACHDNGIKWIAVKAISDWGYDKTDEHQRLARQNLYDFLFFVLSEGLIN